MFPDVTLIYVWPSSENVKDVWNHDSILRLPIKIAFYSSEKGIAEFNKVGKYYEVSHLRYSAVISEQDSVFKILEDTRNKNPLNTSKFMFIGSGLSLDLNLRDDFNSQQVIKTLFSLPDKFCICYSRDFVPPKEINSDFFKQESAIIPLWSFTLHDGDTLKTLVELEQKYIEFKGDNYESKIVSLLKDNIRTTWSKSLEVFNNFTTASDYSHIHNIALGYFWKKQYLKTWECTSWLLESLNNMNNPELHLEILYYNYVGAYYIGKDALAPVLEMYRLCKFDSKYSGAFNKKTKFYVENIDYVETRFLGGKTRIIVDKAPVNPGDNYYLVTGGKVSSYKCLCCARIRYLMN